MQLFYSPEPLKLSLISNLRTMNKQLSNNGKRVCCRYDMLLGLYLKTERVEINVQLMRKNSICSIYCPHTVTISSLKLFGQGCCLRFPSWDMLVWQCVSLPTQQAVRLISYLYSPLSYPSCWRLLLLWSMKQRLRPTNQVPAAALWTLPMLGGLQGKDDF